MYKIMDITIRHGLKNWVNGHDLPVDGRARLLRLASINTPKAIQAFAFRKFEPPLTPASHYLTTDIFLGSWLFRLTLA